jgi:hypothetical protein
MKLPSRLHGLRLSLWAGVLAAIAAIVVATVLIGVASAGQGDTTTPSTVQPESIVTTPPVSPETGVAGTETTAVLESHATVATVESADVPNIPGQPEVLATQRALTFAEAILASAAARIPELAELSMITALEYHYPEQPLVLLDFAVGEKTPSVSIGIQKNISQKQFSGIPDVVGASERMQVAGCVDGIFEDFGDRFQVLLLLADGTVVNVASIGYGPKRPAPISAAQTKELAQIVATEFALTAFQDLTDGY